MVALILLAATQKAKPLARIERIVLRLTVPMLQLVPAWLIPWVMAQGSVATRELRAAARRLLAHVPKHRLVDVWRGTVELLDTPHRPAAPLGLVHGAADLVSLVSRALPYWNHATQLRTYLVHQARHIVTWMPLKPSTRRS